MTRPVRRQSLSVASECAPLAKSGGLADVVGALPKYLDDAGWHQRVLLPAYPGVLDAVAGGGQVGDVVWEDPWLFGGRGRVRAATYAGLDLLLLDAPHLFDRFGGLYGVNGRDYGDNDSRFAALSWAAAMIAMNGTSEGWRPDLLHAHDWQAGLAPAYVKFAGGSPPPVPTVMTIHNIAFQGVFGLDQGGWLRIPLHELNHASVEYNGLISTLKAGLVHADKVTTVSPTYARELTDPQFGFGLEGVIASRAADFSGIVNGVDTQVWDPAADPAVGTPFSATSMAGKAADRAALLAEFGLDADIEGPLAVVVTRLTWQKGVDLLLDAAHVLIERGGALVVLGAGDREYEDYLHELMWRHLGRVGIYIGYNEPLSHRMFAGGDVTLVPSRFEPCGLTQLYGLRYGTVPVVASTGGLADTVVHASPEALADGTATGVQFFPNNGDSLKWALGHTADLFADRPVWEKLRATAMASPVDWSGSARQYAALYDSLVPAAG